MTLLPAMSEMVQATTRIGAGDLNRLTVSTDGRLYWDDKPVVVRRRLQLSFWQKLGTILIGLAALMIALSAAVHATITAHDWMCGAKWVTLYCPKAAATLSTPASAAPPQSQPQNSPSQPAQTELPN